MKKRHLFWIIPCGILALILVPYIIGHLISSVPSKHIPQKSKNKDQLTEKEVKEDLDYLKYYFEELYAGYDLMKADGFDIDAVNSEIYEKTKKDCDGLKYYKSDSFRKNITEVVLKHFNNTDMHFCINESSVLDYRTLYFSDIYVKPQQINGETKYFVVKNQREEIPEIMKKDLKLQPLSDIQIGQEYTGPVENLYEYFDKNEKILRYCVFTTNKIKQARISINGEMVSVPVMASASIKNNQQFQGFKETANTLYVSMSDFVFGGSSSDYSELGKREFQTLCDNVREKSRGKQSVILDLRNNGGGSPVFRNAVFANLIYNQSEISDETIRIISSVGMDNEKLLYSPVTGYFYRRGMIYDIKNYFRDLKYKDSAVKYSFEKWREYEDSVFDKPARIFGFTSFFYPERKYFVNEKYTTERTLPAPDFQGDIYILTNRYSASCSEYSLALAYIFNEMDGIRVHHIGENTCGAVNFVNPCHIMLPNSGGCMYCPSAYNQSMDFNRPEYKGESYGWYPEYWTTSFNLVNTLCNLIKDPELENALAGLEREHL